MPFLDDDVLPAPRAPLGEITQEKPSTFSAGNTLAAAFRTASPVGSVIDRLNDGTAFEPVPGYNPSQDPVVKGTWVERDHIDDVVASRSPAETHSIVKRLERNRKDGETLATAGAFGVVAGLGASLLDPTLILPGGALYRTAKGGVSVGRSVLSVGAAGLAQGLASESILHATQETHTTEDLLTGVAASTLLSGFLGGAAAGLLSRAERQVLERALDADRAALGGVPAAREGGPLLDPKGIAQNDTLVPPAANENAAGELLTPNASVGAAAAESRTLKPVSYVLDHVPWLGTAIERVSPVLRSLQNDIVEVRRAMADLGETALEVVDNADGVATTRGPAASREIGMAQRQTIVALDDFMDDAWKRHRFGSSENAPAFARTRSAIDDLKGVARETLSRKAFSEEVGRALRNGDQHATPEVAEAARWIRSNVFAPWWERFKNLPANKDRDLGDPQTAMSYFSRVYNTEAMKAKPAEVIDAFTRFYHEDQARKFEIQSKIEELDGRRRQLLDASRKVEAKLARAEARLDAIETRADERAAELKRVEGRAEEVEARLADQQAELSELAEAIAAFKEQASSPEMRDKIAGLEREVRELQRVEARSRMSDKDLDALDEQELKGRFLATPYQKAFADMVVGRRKVPKPPSLAAYIAKGGGLNDTGGDVRAMLGGAKRPGFLNKDGLSIDQWGEKLWQDFPGHFFERPSAREVESFIADALRGKEPEWFLEARMDPFDLELMRSRADVGSVQAEMAGAGYRIDDRLEVARFLRDHTDDVAAGMDDAAPGVPAAVLADDAGLRLERARADRAAIREAIERAKRQENVVDRRALRNDARLSELGSAEKTQTGRLSELDRQAAVVERKRVLQEVTRDLLDAEIDDIFARIEKEMEGWGGNTVKEALSAIKAREKADIARRAKAQAEGKPEPLNRLGAADGDVLAAVRRILESDRELSVDELRARAEQTFDRIISSPDGRLPYDEGSNGNGFSLGREAPRGSLARRQFMIPDQILDDLGIVESDADLVVRRYMHTAATDIVLAERFGDWMLTEPIRKIQEGAHRLAAAAKTEKEKQAIFAARDAGIRDIAAVRDRLRGTFSLNGITGSRNAGRVGQAVRAYNVITDLGGATLSSVADLAGAVFRYGFTRVLDDAYRPFIKGLVGSSDAYAKAKRQYRAMGIATEVALATRSHAIHEIAPNYRPQSRAERVLQAGVEKFQVANLMAPWTDWAKTNASIVAGNEIFRAAKAVSEGAASPKQIRNLAASGIDDQLARRIWAEFSRPGAGEVIDGVHLPNTDRWADAGARKAFEGAVGREADIAVVTPGQEKPLWLSDPIIGLIGQHKSFILAASERIMLANLQRRDAATLSGLLTAVSLGMVSAALYSLNSGKDFPKRPQDWVKEGISRSGVLGWLEEVNSISAKATRGSVDAYRLIGADKPLSRYSNLTTLAHLLGPSAGKIETLSKLTGAPFSDEGWTAKDSYALRRLALPGQNLIGIRRGLNEVEDAVNEVFGIPAVASR